MFTDRAKRTRNIFELFFFRQGSGAGGGGGLFFFSVSQAEFFHFVAKGIAADVEQVGGFDLVLG